MHAAINRPDITSLARFVDCSLWVLFLLMLMSFSVLTQRFDTALWQMGAGLFFAVFSVFVLSLLVLEMPINRAGLRSALPILVLMFAIPLWLFLQTVVPGSDERFFDAEMFSAYPDWWRSNQKVSVSPDKTAWLALSSFFLACWCLFALSLLTSRARVKQLLWVIFLTASAHAVAGLVALRTNFYFVDIGQIDGHFNVARGWYVNRNHYASSLAFGGSAAIALLLQVISNARTKAKISSLMIFKATAIFLGLLAIGSAILASQSRAGVLAPIVMLSSFAFISIFARSGIKFGLLGVAIFLTVVFVSLFLLGDQWVTRVSAESFSLGERWLQWTVTLEAIIRAPLLGYGGGSYGAVFQMFRDHLDFRQVIYNQSHNQFLHVWLEQGLIGLLLWLALLTLIVRGIIGSLKNTSSGLVRSVSWASFIAVGASLLQAAVDFNLQIVFILCTFYTFVALLFAVPYVNRRKLKRN